MKSDVVISNKQPREILSCLSFFFKAGSDKIFEFGGSLCGIVMEMERVVMEMDIEEELV